MRGLHLLERLRLGDAPARFSTADLLAATCRPLGALVAGVARLRRPARLLSCFVEGTVANTGPGAVREWAELLRELRPGGVTIRTVEPAVAGPGLWPVPSTRLREIAARLREHAGVDARIAA